MLVQNKINDGADLVHIESGVIERLVIDEIEGPNPQLHFISYLLKLKANRFMEFCTFVISQIKEEREE